MQRTALYNRHIEMGAKMVEFAGWQMPVRYTDIRKEHLAVRTDAGVFDISHMGEVSVTGPDAERYVQWLTTNDIAKITDGQAQYTLLCNEHGGVVDDIIVSKISSDHFFICVNSANTQKDFEWVSNHKSDFNVDIRNESDNWSQIAIQGPRAAKYLQQVLNTDLSDIKPFFFRQISWMPPFSTRGVSIGTQTDLLVSRTGYTGEDGFEIFIPRSDTGNEAVRLWDEVVTLGVEPCGLGCRDTLRIEKAYPLYGHELDDNTSPLEAGLKRFVDLSGADFLGRESTLTNLRTGLKKNLQGFIMLERGVAREGYNVCINGNKVGVVTSGTMSPTLEQAIGLCFIGADIKISEGDVEIEVRNSLRRARIVPLPFVKKH